MFECFDVPYLLLLWLYTFHNLSFFFSLLFVSSLNIRTVIDTCLRKGFSQKSIFIVTGVILKKERYNATNPIILPRHIGHYRGYNVICCWFGLHLFVCDPQIISHSIKEKRGTHKSTRIYR